MQYFKNKTFDQDLRIAQLAHKAKLGILILQKVISSKVHNKLFENMCNKIQGKNT